MSLSASSQKMVGYGMANLLSLHSAQNGQQLPPGRNGAAVALLKQGGYLKGSGVRPPGPGQPPPGILQGAQAGQSSGRQSVQGGWPSSSFPFDQAQEEQLTTIHRLLHSAINNVDPHAAGIILDGTFYPFSAKCVPFQPGRGFLLPPEVETRWDDSLPFPQKPVEQRVLVYYPAEKRVRWEAQTNGRQQVDGTALLVESKTYTLQLEKELCIKYEMRLSQDVLNFMQAKASPTLISHAVRPFRMRASALQAPEIALSVSSAGSLHPDSTWQTRSGGSGESRLSGTPPMEPSNARAISNVFLFHRKLHFPERNPPEPALQNGRFVKQQGTSNSPFLNQASVPLNGVSVAPSLEAKPNLLARDAQGRPLMNQSLARLQNGGMQNGGSALPPAHVILQPASNGVRAEAFTEASMGRPGSGGMGRPPSSHSRQTTGSDSTHNGGRGLNGLNGFRYSGSQELNSWAPALAKAAGLPDTKVRPNLALQPQGPPPAGGPARSLPLGYTMDKISRLSAQQQSLLLQQAQLLQQRHAAQQQAPKPQAGVSSMIPTPGYVPQPQAQPQPLVQQPAESQPDAKKQSKSKARGKKAGSGKQEAHSGPLSPANSAANSSANSHPLSSSAPARNPSPLDLPSLGYDQNIPIAQLLKASRKKHKGDNAASGGSSPTASRDSLKQSQRPLQRATSSVSAASFLSALSNPPPALEVPSPRGREARASSATPGLSLLGGPNRQSSALQGGGVLPFLPTDASSTGSLLDSPGVSNALTGRGHNGPFASAAHSGDSLQGLGGGSMSRLLLGGMHMIPTPGMMPTPGLQAAGRASWDASAELLSDLQSGGNGASQQQPDSWPPQHSSFMDMLTDDAGLGIEEGQAAGAGAADASADPFKEVLDSLDLDLFQEDAGRMQAGVPETPVTAQQMTDRGIPLKDSRVDMEVEMQLAGSQWEGVFAGSGGLPSSSVGLESGYLRSSSGLDHRAREPALSPAGLAPLYMHVPPEHNGQQASTAYVSWDPGTAQQLPGVTPLVGQTLSVGQTLPVGQTLTADNTASADGPSQAQMDAMGLDSGDPGLNGALDELMELDADFLDIGLDDGTLFDGGIGEGDWSNLGGF